MIRTLLIILSCSSLIVLGACGDKDEVNNSPNNTTTENDSTTNNNNTGTATNDQSTQNSQNNSNINFLSFDLDIDYDTFTSFEVNYENEADEAMEAKIEDELNNRTIRGDEAYQELLKHFDQFKFDQNSSTDEVIQEVLESFNLKSDFQKFELEVTFSDGTEKEYQLMK